MRVEPGTIREVIARTDIGALIGNYVALRKRGNDLVGLCPFHGERTPSFHVHPDRGFFKCFGCGAGGDAIAFVERIENVPFPEALRSLAKRAGVELEPEDPRAARVRSEKEAIYEANAAAAALFHRLLKSDPRAKKAREYCEKRGLTSETIDAFKLGCAPDAWDTLVAEFTRDGIDLEIALKAGLVKRGQHGFYDFYRDRLMIPMSATTGEIVAFGGRALGDGEPKYLNTSTTPVYTKGKALFALNVARRAASGGEPLIVVEGYLDCIALHQAGFPQAVASLGTAFTAEQAGELRKYSERAYLCFDADAAGSSATAKSIDVLVESGVFTRIVALPPGEDPDSYVRAYGSRRVSRPAGLFGSLDSVQIRSLDRRHPRRNFPRPRRSPARPSGWYARFRRKNGIAGASMLRSGWGFRRTICGQPAFSPIAQTLPRVPVHLQVTSRLRPGPARSRTTSLRRCSKTRL